MVSFHSATEGPLSEDDDEHRERSSQHRYQSSSLPTSRILDAALASTTMALHHQHQHYDHDHHRDSPSSPSSIAANTSHLYSSPSPSPTCLPLTMTSQQQQQQYTPPSGPHAHLPVEPTHRLLVTTPSLPGRGRISGDILATPTSTASSRYRSRQGGPEGEEGEEMMTMMMMDDDDDQPVENEPSQTQHHHHHRQRHDERRSPSPVSPKSPTKILFPPPASDDTLGSARRRQSSSSPPPPGRLFTLQPRPSNAIGLVTNPPASLDGLAQTTATTTTSAAAVAVAKREGEGEGEDHPEDWRATRAGRRVSLAKVEVSTETVRRISLRLKKKSLEGLTGAGGMRGKRKGEKEKEQEQGEDLGLIGREG